MEKMPAIYIPGETGQVSDGYHTFDELEKFLTRTKGQAEKEKGK